MQRDAEPSGLSPTEVSAVVPSPLAADYELARELVEAVSHHMRTPLTVILGHAGLLVDGEHDLPAATHRALAAVMRAARRLNDVGAGICDLIDVACVDPATVCAVGVAELVADEVAACSDRAAQRGLRLLLDGDPEARCVVDPRRLRRALRELLDNALTYAPSPSTLGVITTATAAGIRVTVSDQGDGIESADRERLVRPFERGTHPGQPIGGLGMGLALASAVATAHGGQLILSESMGGGLQACLEVPFDFTSHDHGATPRRAG